MQRRSLSIIIALLIGALATLSLAYTLQARALSAHARSTHVEETLEKGLILSAESQNPTPLGEPCGCGEQMSPWVLCLHGAVSLIHPSGQVELLDSISITVTLGDNAITGTTFIHPGYTTPTFGLDISPLAPAFLDPVTLTAVVSGTIMQQQVLVFPDFATQSQQYNLYATAAPVLAPAPIWGHVVAFSEGGPVADATVTAEHGGASVVVTSAVQPFDALPAYALSAADLASIGAGMGSTVTLTARYGGDTDRRAVRVAGDPLQVDFVTGWMCADVDPLPRTGGGAFLPRTGGGAFLPRTGGGAFLPDLACFWGYGAVNGVPAEGVSVRLVVSDTAYEAQTRLYPGETVPRYGIGVWGGRAISGQMAMATGVYSGHTASEVATVTLDANLSQRMDLSIAAGADVLANLTNIQAVKAAVRHAGYLWIGTTGGVVRLDPYDGSTVRFTTVDGLAHNDVRAVAVAGDGSLWFGTMAGASRYTPGSGEWQTFLNRPYRAVYAIVPAPDDSLWFALSDSLRHYTPGTGEWTAIPIAAGLPVNCTYDLAIAPDGSLWLATRGGVGRYTPEIGEWEVLTTTAGLVNNEVNAVVVDLDGSVWFGTRAGVSHYTPVGDTWETFTTAHGLAHNTVDAIAIAAAIGGDDGSDGSLWFGSTWGSALSRYIPTSDTWETFTAGDGLLSDQVMAIVADGDGSMWFISFGCGVSHYVPGSGEWSTYTVAVGLADNAVTAIAFDKDGSLWFGTSRGVSRYTPATGQWRTLTTLDGLASNNVRGVAIAANGTMWFGTASGVSHYDDAWETFTTAVGLAADDVRAIAVVPDGSLWFGTAGGVSHYTPATDHWRTYTTAAGLVSDDVRAVTVGADGSVWFGTAGGASHYAPVGDTWETFTTAHGLVNNDVRAIAIAPIDVDGDGALWFGSAGGASGYTPATGEWEAFTRLDGLVSDDVRAVAVVADGTVWLGTGGGASHYSPGGAPEWETLTADDGLAGNRVLAVAVDADGAPWFGTDGGVSYWQYVPPKSDLALQAYGPAAALPGQPVTYVLYLANQGQVPAADTILTFTLPMSATYLDASLAPSNTGPLVWSLDTMLAPDAVSLVVTATLDATASPGTALVATAAATTPSDEPFLANNTAQVRTVIRDPDRADARVALSAPPLLVPGAQARYDVWADNAGGLDAQAAVLTVALPADLAYQAATPLPLGGAGGTLAWDLGALPALDWPTTIALTVTVSSAAPTGADLGVMAVVTTTSPDADPLNNTAVVTASTSLTDAFTLILVAPDRLAGRYGASPLLADLHRLADHPRVRGVVLDVAADPAVRAAYGAWDGDPGDWQKANAVAQAIKGLVDQYTVDYPNLRYLVIVGSDDVMPFYRVQDRNPLMWRESRYRAQTPPGTVRAALAADMVLTDDFYADRTPTTPSSPFWSDGRPFYLPDFAIGRLIETPQEIAAVIDAFLADDGAIALDLALVGSIDPLTGDLGQAQCAALSDDSIAATCTTELDTLHQTFLGQSVGSTWAAVHGNHFSLGTIATTDILNRTLSLGDTLLVATSCHAGLSVPASSGPQPDDDLVQALASRGGTAIAPTAYAYASSIGTGYSEALALELTHRLLAGQAQEVGPALVQAKRAYYTDHAGWFDATDEKALLAVTLYGLPMLRVTTPDSTSRVVTQNRGAPQHARVQIGSAGVVTYTFSDLTFDQYTTGDGVYYAYEGQVIAQDGLPVQPALQVILDETPVGGAPRGVLLCSAGYTEHAAFDPVIAQSWAIGERQSVTAAEPPTTLTGWDRALPYALARFEGLTATTASLNLVPGLYDAGRQTEQLFDGLVLEVLYGDGAARSAPDILSASGEVTGSVTYFQARVVISDTEGARVGVVYDDEQGHWRSLALTSADGENWAGETANVVRRFYVQAADAADAVGIGGIGGDVSTSAWMQPTRKCYLPLILCGEP